MPVISTNIRDSYEPTDKESNIPKEDEVVEEQLMSPTPHSTGFIPDPPDSRDYQFSTIMKSYTTVNSVDYTQEMSPVKDQGSKGSCVGFAVAAVLE